MTEFPRVALDLRLVTPPAVSLLSLDEAKAQCTVDFIDDDDLLEALIATATATLDGHAGQLGRCLIHQTWQVSYDYAFPSWRIPLPLGPLVSVTSIKYVDNAGVTQTLDPAVYTVIDGPVGAVEPAFNRAWPSPRSQVRAVTITFVAGYGATAAAVPAPLRAAARLLLSHLYEHRDAVVGVDARDSSAELPLGVTNLIAPYKARSVY